MKGAILFATAALLGAAVPAAAQDLAGGKALFEQHCAVCHQPGGVGLDGLAPPLTANPGRYSATDAGRQALARVALYGMYGQIESGGKHFNGNMPPFGGLPDSELADVLNYLVFDLSAATRNPDATPYRADELAGLRAQPVAGSEVRRQRMKVLDGGAK
ncbi:c-type cytochrome [Cupriavidus pinatubonensis]|uniref:c-type cytochrome n=1 Tax=Cupriavidus pinatubonensis TaxID=248026 RepID=UPI0011280C72|nr:cytochrome c [Cupriavidus pinatubonensis]TPQ37987.1 cytochrome C [Cupriavidus pinatubonensis]